MSPSKIVAKYVKGDCDSDGWPVISHHGPPSRDMANTTKVAGFSTVYNVKDMVILSRGGKTGCTVHLSGPIDKSR